MISVFPTALISSLTSHNELFVRFSGARLEGEHGKLPYISEGASLKLLGTRLVFRREGKRLAQAVAMLAGRYCLCGDWHHEAGFRAES